MLWSARCVLGYARGCMYSHALLTYFGSFHFRKPTHTCLCAAFDLPIFWCTVIGIMVEQADRGQRVAAAVVVLAMLIGWGLA